MADKIHLAILWHQHQPFYKDLKTGKAVMPWTRLHATKDYFDMAAILDDFPSIRLTINLVPSLVAQLEDFAKNQVSDPWLDKTLIPAKQLQEDDKIWILENFFHCNWETMIFPNKRFGELFEKRGKHAGKEEIKRKKTYFNVQDFLDLQVWFNLAWMDPYWQEKDTLVSALFKKGKNFTEEEKLSLIAKQREICGLVIQKHKELWEKDRIEISTSPFYHPILPLLCDTDAAQMAMPGSLKPKTRFQHPEDARLQIQKALEYMEKTLGRKPVGMWPSEGSVSEETIGLLHEAGIRWAATDEGVLFHSLRILDDSGQKREQIYQPYSVEPDSLKPRGGGSVQMIFRDHSLSDAIGFVYSRMDPKKAAEDFIDRICKIADALPEQEPALVSVILDGENCWEYYARDGHDFLRALYGALSNHPRIETTTVSSYLDRFPPRKTLKKLWAGSWINTNFAIWIGHPEDNAAWDWVSSARKFLHDYLAARPEESQKPEVQLAKESLLIAEGSDWCWWYGDQNSTAQDSVFDGLFRSHLSNVYAFLGAKIPEKLAHSIKQKQDKETISAPVGLIHPRIDGQTTTYFEWRSGGSYRTAATGGTMHQADSFLSSFHYGFDMDKFYLRIDPQTPFKAMDLNPYLIHVSFLEPKETAIRIQLGTQKQGEIGRPAIQSANLLIPGQEPKPLKEAAIGKVLELAIAFSDLGVQTKDTLEFAIQIFKENRETERWPLQTSVQLKRPGEDFGLDFWSV